MPNEPPSLYKDVHFTSLLSNIYISETSGPIAIKFYLKHQWAGGKAALDFGADRFRTLVSMTTEDPIGF